MSEGHSRVRHLTACSVYSRYFKRQKNDRIKFIFSYFIIRHCFNTLAMKGTPLDEYSQRVFS